MSQHLGFDDAQISGRSRQGTFNIEQLHLNDEASLRYRGRLIDDAKVLIGLILEAKQRKGGETKKLLDGAVAVLSRMTYRSEESIRKACGLIT